MFRRRHPETGARPGTLLLGPKAEPVVMRVTAVRGSHCTVSTCTSVSELPQPESPDNFVWIDVRGVGDGRVLEEIARRFRISPLAMEDLVNAPQRPKMELFDHQQLIIAHTVPAADQAKEPKQLGILFDRKYVLTFHAHCEHVLNPIHQRLESPSGRLSAMEPTTLFMRSSMLAWMAAIRSLKRSVSGLRFWSNRHWGIQDRNCCARFTL